MREDVAVELKGRIAAAQSLFVLTGAGMSAESGIAIVNPHASEIDDEAHVVLRATAAQALPRLLAP